LSSIAEGEAWTFGDVAPRKALPRSLVIGVDIDGVLGDQIAGIIPRVASDHSVHLTFDMIDDYRFTLGRVSIADEIAKAQASRDYVEKMPTFPGARQMLEALRQDHRVIIVTARAPETRDATRVWLARERLVHDGLVFTAEAGKSAHGLDVLVDDYLENLVDFLTNTTGLAILVRRPWNRKDEALLPFVASHRALVATRLGEIPAMVRTAYPRQRD
jgi:uncharacterized HAD superfamily protein